MADLNSAVHVVDENGNVNNIFPATKIENVEGLQTALNTKANSSDVTSGLAGKVDKENGKGLSTNDYTTSEKNKLAGIEAQANKTVVDDALSSTSTNPLQNKVINTALGTKANASDVTTALASKADVTTVSNLSDDLDTQTARIDAIASLPSGSTSGDAELMDIRVKADGSTASSAGDAVRAQYNLSSHPFEVADGADLNSVTTAGFAHLAYAGTYSNSPIPANNQRFLEITNNNGIIMQRMTNPETGDCYVRRKTGGSWAGWNTISRYMPIEVADGTDLNTVTTAGYAHLSYAGAYTNSPIPANNQRFLEITNNNGIIMQRMINPENGNCYVRRKSGGSWMGWCTLSPQYMPIEIEDGTDLNTVTTAGYAHLSYAGAYTNSPIPANNQRFLEVTNNDNIIMQRMTNPETGDCYVRRKAGGSWAGWCKLSLQYMPFEVADGADLNSVTTAGFAHLAYAGTYSNSPIPANNQRFLEITNNNGIIMQRMTNPETGDCYVRRKAGGSWAGWHELLEQDKDTELNEFVDYSSNIAVNNSGKKIRVLSYNVANFDNDTGDKGIASEIYEEKVFNIKKMLLRTNPDLIGMQEYYKYIDAEHTKQAKNYLLNPVFPFVYGESGIVTASKLSANGGDLVRLGERGARFITISVDNKTILFVNFHAVAQSSQATSAIDNISIAERYSEYTNLFKFVNHEITLPKMEAGTDVQCPSWDYCIIAGDTNSLTDTDKSNIVSICNAYNFTLANGGYLGWVNTAKGDYSIDNIICSSNIIINNIDSLGSKYKDLYSDHFPFVAELVLL